MTPWTPAFQSTPPARGATHHTSPARRGLWNFNPRPPRGGRLQRLVDQLPQLGISIHAPREGGDLEMAKPEAISVKIISIHAPREGGDGGGGHEGQSHVSISIHAPREGGDIPRWIPVSAMRYFNPRPPRGGRLLCGGNVMERLTNFNPRPPRGGATLTVCLRRFLAPSISIHAPREGGDVHAAKHDLRTGRFQSTPPARGATSGDRRGADAGGISIHAPREGGDG